MRKIYTYISIALFILPSMVNAQQDTTLNRQVLLEREYNPTLRDASKINTLPSIYNPAKPSIKASYIEKAPFVKINSQLLGKVGSGDIHTDVDYDTKNGYLRLGAGSNSNLEAIFGYKLVESPTDTLNLSATYGSTSGNVNYESKDFLTSKAKAKYADSKINLGYSHLFGPSIFSFGAYYRNMSYNYYGNPYWRQNDEFKADYYDLNKRQGVNVFNFNAALQSSDKNSGILKYIGSVGYSYFKNKYGPLIENDGIKGGQLDLRGNFYTEYDTDNIIGVKGKIINQSISDPKYNFKPYAGSFHNLTNIEATPYFKTEGSNWNVDLGLNAGCVLDYKRRLFFSPEIHANLVFAEANKLYFDATGGINENTFLQLLDENRYINPMSRVGYSRTPLDLKVGLNSGIIKGFEFGVFGGYKHTKDDHLFMSTSYYYVSSGDATAPLTVNTYSWGNVSTPFYANISTGHLGGMISTSLIPKTNLSVKATGYFYNVKYVNGYLSTYVNAIPEEKKAWGRPTFTVDVNADVNLLPQLNISLNYMYAGGRKAYIGPDRESISSVGSISMNAINELNVHAEYKIRDWVSVYAQLNNVFDRKYEMVQGYTLQGFNGLGGLSFKF